MVFMDIYMDGMDGVSAAARMRERDKNCLLVFLTSSAEFMPEAFSCHAFEYVTKPFSGERIAAVLRDALKVLPDTARYIEIQSDRKRFLFCLAALPMLSRMRIIWKSE